MTTLKIGHVTLPRVGDARVDTGFANNLATLSGRLDGFFSDIRKSLQRLEEHVQEVVPITWDDDPTQDGWYEIMQVQQRVIQAVPTKGIVDFTVTCARVGSVSDVEWESKLVGAVRGNAHGLTAELWHAPPVGHSSWWGDTTSPSVVTRASVDGDVAVYRDVDAAVDPLWSVPVADWYKGAALVSSEGLAMAGEGAQIDSADWELSNGLLRITPATTTGHFEIAAWDGTVWDALDWRFLVSGSIVTDWLPPRVLRNDPNSTILRFVEGSSGPGRTTLDLSLLRGSRTVRARLQNNTSATLRAGLSSAAAGTSITGGMRATSATAAGNRWVLASADAITKDLVNGDISAAAVVALDVMIGFEVAGAGAQAGDTAADLVDQHLGAPQERVRAVSR